MFHRLCAVSIPHGFLRALFIERGRPERERGLYSIIVVVRVGKRNLENIRKNRKMPPMSMSDVSCHAASKVGFHPPIDRTFIHLSIVLTSPDVFHFFIKSVQEVTGDTQPLGHILVFIW